MRQNFKNARVFAAVFLGALLGACGGGTSESPPASAPAIAPPSGLSYPATPAWVVGQAITPLTPTVTGTVTSYSVTPALPAGLTLNAQTGAIAGTPTAIAAAAAHTVTASNASGSTTATISIVVNDIAPAIAYGNDQLHFTTGVALNPVTPAVTGGTPVSWRVEPTLPQGLAFGAADGRITGTPTELAAAQSYLVTATNSGGQSQASLTISVESGVLLELGHASRLERLRLSATRALSQDGAGHWVLWNLGTREMLAQGDTALPVDLAGATVVVQSPANLETRAAADGHVLATIAASDISSWKLASDGTYVVAASATGLRAWAPTGASLFTRAGDYSHAIAFAAPAEVRVARGAAGNNVIEQLTVPSGTAASGPAFLGDFHSWFLDGERFLTNVGTTVRVYSKAGIQQDIAALPTVESLTGQGAWFWIDHLSTMKLYAVGSSTAPTASYTYGILTRAVASGTQLAVLAPGVGRLRIVDLSGAAPADAEYQVPHGLLSAFGVNDGGKWLIGNCCGVLLDGSSLAGPIKYYGYGAALSVAGSSARAAIATASGKILLFDAATRLQEGSIAFDASHVELTSDGAVLAAAANASYFDHLPDRTLKFYALPAGTLLDERPYTLGTGPALMDMSLAASGEFVAENLFDATTGLPSRRVTPVAGGAAIYSDTGPLGAPLIEPFRLSPSGHRVAITSGATATNIYENGSLIGAAPGWAVGWIDEGRLLLNQKDAHGQYQGATINDASGAQLAPVALPELPSIQPLDPEHVYSARPNSILSLATGAATWTGSRPATNDLGAVAGPVVVFVSGTEVRAEPR